jgi:hypothetical protein
MASTTLSQEEPGAEYFAQGRCYFPFSRSTLKLEFSSTVADQFSKGVSNASQERCNSFKEALRIYRRAFKDDQVYEIATTE